MVRLYCLPSRRCSGQDTAIQNKINANCCFSADPTALPTLTVIVKPLSRTLFRRLTILNGTPTTHFFIANHLLRVGSPAKSYRPQDRTPVGSNRQLVTPDKFYRVLRRCSHCVAPRYFTTQRIPLPESSRYVRTARPKPNHPDIINP